MLLMKLSSVNAAGKRCGTTRRHEDVKQISFRIRKGRVDDLKIVGTVHVSINEDIDLDIARRGPFAVRGDAKENLGGSRQRPNLWP